MKKALALILTLIMVLGLMPAAMAATAAEGEVTITKSLYSATPDADGNYTIKLTVQGNPVTQSAQPNADVVLVVDNSGSMASSVGDTCNTPKAKFKNVALGLFKKCPTCGAVYSFLFVPELCTGQTGTTVRINAARDVGKTFAENILSGTGNEMAVIGFAGSSGGVNGNNAIKVSTGLTDNLNTIKSKIDEMSAEGGTNYTAALQRACDILNGRQDKNRPGYVIFISDGAPGAQGESQGDSAWDGSEQVAALKNDGITIYTIGIALDDNGEAYKYLKNMASKDQDDHFKNVSGTDYQDQLNSILNDWAGDINTVPAGTNAVMTDVINTEKFDYVEGSASTELTVSEDKTTLTWNIGNIPEEEQSVTFKVKPKDGWTGTEDTNKSCTLTYKDYENKDATKSANSPQVKIAATTGKIVVTKNVVMPVGDNTSVNGKEYSFTITQEDGTYSETKKVTIGDNNTGSVTFKNVPFGNYTVTESGADVTGYDLTVTNDKQGTSNDGETGTVAVTADEASTITFTNTYTLKTVNIPVMKVWVDNENEHPPVTVKLLADGQAVEGKTLTLGATATTGGDQWTGTFTNLPKYNAEGKEIEYTVQEDPVPEGYKSAVTGTVENGFTITNTKLAEGKTVVTVQKTWEAPDGTIFPEVSVNVFKDNEVVDTIKLNKDNGWMGSSKELDKYPDGAIVGADPIAYTVQEEVPDGYTAATTRDTNGVWQITNKIEKQYTVRLVKKVEGYESHLSEVEVTVENQEGTYKKTHKVPVNNFTDIQVPAGTYTVTENTTGIQVPGYTLNTTYAPNEFTVPADTADTADAVGIAATVTVTNTYEKINADLVVYKNVTGNRGNYSSKAFTFRLTLTQPTFEVVAAGNVAQAPVNSAPPEINYSSPWYRIVRQDGTKEEGSVTVGMALEFNLGNGERLELYANGDRYDYEVKETNSLGHDTTVNGNDKGTIDVEKPTTVTFNNYKSGGGHYYPTPDPVPPIVIPPKTGDMTIWQSILHFLGIR